MLVEPGRLVWADVVVPAGDPLADDDVGRAAWWLGEAWTRALADLGIPGGVVHHGGLVRSEWSSLVCFAGLGPGEVTVGGAKVGGMSQRRTRAGALFQCAALLDWQPARLLDRLALGDDDRRRGTQELAGAARAVDVNPGTLVAALLDRLP